MYDLLHSSTTYTTCQVGARPCNLGLNVRNFLHTASENVWKEIMGHVKLGGNMLKIYVITQ